MHRSAALRSLALVLSVAILCSTTLPMCAEAAIMDPTQVSALLESKQELDPDFGGIRTWTQSNLENACNTADLAFGIKSCNASGFVTEIDIPYLQGDNHAPAAWSKLVALVSLRLDAGLIGSLPASWSSLTKLEKLSIAPYSGSQKLLGGFPASWSAMTALKSLNVVFGSTSFVRNPPPPTVPPTWLARIPDLTVTNADWTGSELPAAWGDSATSQIDSLTLTTCFFSGGFPFLSNTRIRIILIETLAPSKFGTGFTMPTDFSRMTNLTSIAFVGGYFTGSLPSKMPASIRTAHFSYLYGLTGTIPQALVDTPNLSDLNLAFLPSITGDIPGPSNPSSVSLQYFTAVKLGVTGTISPRLFSTSSLLGIDFQILEEMTGTLPIPLANPAANTQCNLRTVSIINSAVKGSVPPEIFTRCTQLAYVDFSSNKLTGQLPNLAPLPNTVSTLKLSNNNFGGTIPTINFTITGLGPVGTFMCSGCSLTGTVPPTLVTNNLVSLDLSYNKLDLCANAAAIQATGFTDRPATSFVCSLVGQTPRECGCPDLWQTSCFPKRPMAADCGNLPPDTLPPPPTPYSTTTPLYSGNEPTNAAPQLATIPSLALLLVATIIAIIV